MIAAVAARATLVLGVLAALLVLIRRRARLPAVRPPIDVLARASFGAGVGVAVVETDGRRFLVGWGRDGVRLVRDLGATRSEP